MDNLQDHSGSPTPAKTAPPAPFLWRRMASDGITVKVDRKLDYETISAAAMAIADSSGIGQLTMRNLALRLDSGAMSLYRYVLHKDDLLDLIFDRVFAEIPTPAARVAYDWRRSLIEIAIATRQVMLQHPWIATLFIRRPMLGPNYLRWQESLLAATATSGRSIDAQSRIIGSLWAYLSGYLIYEFGDFEMRRNEEPAAHSQQSAHLQEQLSSGKLPHLAKFLKSRPPTPSDAEFEFGLKALLEGLAIARLA